ncbi:MAG: HypC/HybG/HupF family hydrogenase formation chaperone [Candidatus Aenigmatarchaeota archaeon]
MNYKIENFPLFLKYAYPCMEFWFKNKMLAMKIRKKDAEKFFKVINEKLLSEIKLIAMGKKKMNKKIEKNIEKLVPLAFNFILKLGKKRGGKVLVNEEAIRKYFCVLHGKIIEKEKKLFKKYENFFELCDVKEGKIIEIKGNMAKVKISNKEREVNLDFIENPRIGEKVKVHFFHACEKI